MNNAYLLLGGNLGDVEKTFKSVINDLNDLAGSVDIVSGLYVSEPWGFASPDPFLNQALLLKTLKTPHELIDILLEIETRRGRTRNIQGLASRSVDIDILFFDDLIINDERLVIPHPRIHIRNFALIPLCEIAPGLVHPVFKKTILDLKETSNDTLGVTPYIRS